MPRGLATQPPRDARPSRPIASGTAAWGPRPQRPPPASSHGAAAAATLAVAAASAALAAAARQGRRRRAGSTARSATKAGVTKVREELTAKIDSRLSDLASKIQGALEVQRTAQREASELQRKLQAEIDEERKISTELSQRIDSLQRAYSSVSDTMEFREAEANTRLDTMQESLSGASVELEEARRAAQDLQKRLAEAEDEERLLKEELERVAQQLNAANVKNELGAKREKEMAAQLEAKEADLKQAAVKLSDSNLVQAELKRAKDYVETQNQELLEKVSALQEKESMAGELSGALKVMEEKLRLSAEREQDLLEHMMQTAEAAAKVKEGLGQASTREAELLRVKQYFEEQNKALIDQVTHLQGKGIEAAELAKLLELTEEKVKIASQKQQTLVEVINAKDKEIAEVQRQLKNAEVREGEYQRVKEYYETQNKQLMGELEEAHASNKQLEDEFLRTEQKLENILAKFH